MEVLRASLSGFLKAFIHKIVDTGPSPIQFPWLPCLLSFRDDSLTSTSYMVDQEG